LIIQTLKIWTTLQLLHYIHLTAFFQENLGKPTPER